ncbi:MAG TPA: 3-isopropylmalate dehydratase small subunit [Steroidobacteraceae bacterium]|nr:3-isopropylmalate dehydratase small subunit [Steroidobacteraceae bacterium]
MEKVSVIRGSGAALLQPNIDTEVIISVERVMTFDRGELGPYCLEALRFRSDGSENADFVLNQPRYREATVLIAGENFGCGSSREAAVWSFFDRGIRCIISPSFGDIFYTNCLQNGLLPIVMPIEEVQRLAAELAAAADPAMTVDLLDHRITSASGRIVPFTIDVGKRAALLGGLDEISQTLLNLAPAIAAFEATDRKSRPWIYAGVARRRAARVLLLAGDGIGPEVMGEVRRVIEWYISRRGLDLELREDLYGISSWHAHGAVVRDQAWAEIRTADAVLFGAAGSPAYAKIPRAQWPAETMRRIRKELGLFVNLRPIRIAEGLSEMSSLSPDVVRGTDLLIVRGLAGGAEIEGIARVAFEMARVRRARMCAVDRANASQVTGRWREVVQALHGAEYPDVALQHMHVEAAAVQLGSAPQQFDVLLTEHLFGDILSASAAIAGRSIDMFPAASLGIADAEERRRGLYQPIHGSASGFAGKSVANPIGAILSFGMCLQFSVAMPQEARLLRQAVDTAVASGARTPDIASAGVPAMSTAAVGDMVLAALESLLRKAAA